MHKLIRNISAVLLAAVAISCDDYIDYDNVSSDVIRFDVSVSGKQGNSAWQSPTRAAGEQNVEVAKLRNETNGKTMYLHTEIADYPDEAIADMETKRSRGAIVQNTDNGFKNMYSEFAVSAYYYQDDWGENDFKNPSYFFNQLASGSNKSYDLEDTRYWPTTGKMRFLAYAPANYVVNDTNRYQIFNSHWERLVPGLQIMLPERAEDQRDLLIAYTKGLSCKSDRAPADINFKHPLTCVRFAFSDDMVRCRIKKVTMAGLQWEAQLVLDDFSDDTKESSADNPLTQDNFVRLWYEPYVKTFTLEPTNHIVTEPGGLITPEDNSFIMLPQTVDGQEVTITLEQVDENGVPSGKDEVIKGTLPQTVWESGRIVTYKVSYLAQNFTVQQPYHFDYMGKVYDSQKRVSGDFLDYNPVTITSYVGSTSELVDWTMTYSEDGGKTFGNSCSWLTNETVDIAGSTSTKLLKFSVPDAAIQQNIRSIDIDQNLRSQASVGSQSAPMNLAYTPRSANGIIGETSNCYIVDAPGWYSLPLVYGNGVQNSAEQKKAYTFAGSSQSGVAVLPTFKNYKNADISSAYIKNDVGASTPASAVLVWQDENGLVNSSSVEYVSSLYGGKGGIRFNIPSGSTLKQGNAVLALRDSSGSIIWSWHIWVTRFDFDETIEITGHNNQAYNLMTMNLGWCSAHGDIIRFFPERSCIVRFTAGNLIKDIHIVQESHIAFTRGNNTYYQWGRKDPFVAQIAAGTSSNDGTKPWYDSANTEHAAKPVTISGNIITVGSLGTLIQNPGKWQTPPFTGTVNVDATSANKTYSNLWRGDAKTSTTVYKTIYDPCPVGYQVGDYQPFTSFTTTGTGDTGAEVNVVKYVYTGNPTANLMEFYTNGDKCKSTIFPLTGYRDWVAEAAAYIFNEGGHIWSNEYCYWTSIDNAYYFRFLQNGYKNGVAVGNVVDPVNAYFTCDGFALRPLKQ